MMMFSLFACLTAVVALMLDCLEMIVRWQSFFDPFCRCVSRLASYLLGLRVTECQLAPRESLLYVVRQNTLFDVLVMLAFAEANGLSHERLFQQLSNVRGPFRFVRIVYRVAHNGTFAVPSSLNTAGPVALLLNDVSRAAGHEELFRSVVYVAVWYDEQRVQRELGKSCLEMAAEDNCLVPRTAHILHDKQGFAVVDFRVEQLMPIGADEKCEFEYQTTVYNMNVMLIDWPRLPCLLLAFRSFPLATLALLARVIAAHLHMCLFRRANRSLYWLYNITVVVDFAWRMVVLSWWWCRLLHCFCLFVHINIETGFAYFPPAFQPMRRRLAYFSFLIWHISWLLLAF
eukprot:TRINITY_DN18396_c0_g1_i1.p1 TRINITY_DN18396_c0_g1~~TRINITY_DN18396_c0_g1_i1.p1  ORF type:complete len:360 (+),score=-1.70 TRINITY_DN18396_c0_g1_i1:50-1081(+)